MNPSPTSPTRAQAQPTCPNCGHLATLHDRNGCADCAKCYLTQLDIITILVDSVNILTAHNEALASRLATQSSAISTLEAANALLAQRVTDLEAALRDARHHAFSEAVELAYRESPRLQNVNDAIKLLIALRDMAGVS